jgi:hypothetical protein
MSWFDSRALLRLFPGLVLLEFFASPGFSQVTVGYSSITSVVGSAVVDQAYRQRTTDQYEITGVNVEPVDGGNVFDRNTTWKIYDQPQPWSLNVVDNNPKVEVSKESTSTKLVQAGRRESVYSVLSRPVNNIVERQSQNLFGSVFLPAVVPVSTTVFP